MEKIYSRRRFIFPKVQNHKCGKNKTKKSRFFEIVVIAVIAAITSGSIIEAITPVIDKECSNIAKSIATRISNEQATIVMSEYKYEDLCNITKDSSGNITMINANVVAINKIISDISIRIQDELDKQENSNFKIRLGTFTGMKIFAGRGPNVNVKMSTIGNLDTNLKSEFYSSGINQTVHKIYLQIECTVAILTPFATKEEKIENQVLLIEAVIVGMPPSTYYNFNETDGEAIMETIQ